MELEFGTSVSRSFDNIMFSNRPTTSPNIGDNIPPEGQLIATCEYPVVSPFSSPAWNLYLGKDTVSREIGHCSL